MAEFQVGDWVRRRDDERSPDLPCTDGTVVQVAHCDGLGNIGFKLQDGGFGWYAHRYELVSVNHTDADLAMALQLAKTLKRHAWHYDLDDRGTFVSDWLIDCVENELLSRGAK